VLLVDTSKPDWPIVHANSGWQRLLDQCATISNASYSARSSLSSSSSSGRGGAGGSSSVSSGSRHEGEWQSSHTAGKSAAAAAAVAAAAGADAAGDNKLEGFCCGVPPGVLQPIGEDNSSHAAASSAGKAGSATGNSSSSNLIGKSLWSMVDGQVLAQLGSSKSSSSSSNIASGSSNGSSGGSSLIGVGSGSGWCPGDQIVEQVRGRQSFTLRGVKLAAGFGGAFAQLSFR
jgi:hypothetical protein